ncbi:MAG: elongation factor P maturation arginine rhamnosyltransferase EarP [Brachymonas sp.]
MSPALRWDIFCRVIDNFGDIGVCWRLARALAVRGQSVRLWVDDASALAWMSPEGCAGVAVHTWQPHQAMPPGTMPADVVIEAFGCDIDHAWIAMNRGAPYADFVPANSSRSLKKSPVWINLEYLSAESFVQRSHRLPSPVMSGPAAGMGKWFFYPGFTIGTGGVLRDMEIAAGLQTANTPRRISLFCYEPSALAQLLDQLAQAEQASELMVLPGRGQVAFKTVFQNKNQYAPAWNMRRVLFIQELSAMPQTHYDALLQRCDLNFVRGEDSLVRALLAGQAFVWQIYPQEDGAHARKLEAFLDWLQAPPDLREFHRVWNGLEVAPLPPLALKNWQTCAQAARERLLSQADLATQLLDFVQEKRNSSP